MVLLSVEKYFFRGAEGYETARRATVWNGLLPNRFPDVIVQAHDTDDVVAALRYARANGHKVGVRSGGHSWAASHLRDGGLLLDVSRLDHCAVDPDRMTADVGPGNVASVFAPELDSQGLFFPAGHCEGIRLACTPCGRTRPTPNGTATGPGRTWRRCRTWQPGPKHESAGDGAGLPARRP